jgi:hypothetical protein
LVLIRGDHFCVPPQSMASIPNSARLISLQPVSHAGTYASLPSLTISLNMGQNTSRGQGRAQRERETREVPVFATLDVPGHIRHTQRDTRNLSRSESPAISRSHSRDDLIMVLSPAYQCRAAFPHFAHSSLGRSRTKFSRITTAARMG